MIEANLVTLRTVNANALFPRLLKTRSHEKVNIRSMSSEPAAVIKSYRTRADDADLSNPSGFHVQRALNDCQSQGIKLSLRVQTGRLLRGKPLVAISCLVQSAGR
jgi:hypothetical protein